MKNIFSSIFAALALTASAEYIRQATETYPGGSTIRDYTTTNAVKDIVAGEGYVKETITNGLASTAWVKDKTLQKRSPVTGADGNISWNSSIDSQLDFNGELVVNGEIKFTGADSVLTLVDKMKFDTYEITSPEKSGKMALVDDIPDTWDWSAVVNTPTDISGYGITDAYTKSEIDAKGFVTESITNGILEAANEYTDEQVGGVWVTLNPTHTATTNIQAYLGGQNVRVSVTNYYAASSGNLPRLRIEENVSNNWNTVWDEDDKFGLFQSNIVVAVADMTNTTITVVTNALHAGLATKAPLAWGSVTSRGGTTPDDTVWISHPKTVFAGDAEFQSVAVGAGEIYVVVSKGTGVYSQGNPGTFRFTTADNDWYFGMRIEDSYLLGCNTDGITVTPIAGGNMVTLDYNVTMVGKPILYYKSALTNEVWEQLNDSTGAPIPGASVVVSWEAAPPAAHEYAYINVGAAPQGYFTAYVETAGSQSFETNLPIDAKGGILCSNETTHAINVIEPYFDAGGEIKWRVKP